MQTGQNYFFVLKISKNYAVYERQLRHMIRNFSTEGELLVSGKRNTIKTFELNDQLLNIKSFQVPHFLNRFVYRFIRKSKARRSFEFGEKLLEMEILTPAPVAFFEEHNFSGLKSSFYISEHLTNAFTFRDLIEDVAFPDRVKILKLFTRFTHKIHEKEVWFLDHSPGNTLIKKSGDGYKFYLVDINRMRFERLTPEQRIDNFSRLSASAEMLEIMGAEYARLCNWSEESTVEKFIAADQKFRNSRKRKRKLKSFLFYKMSKCVTST